ncbi:MAG: TRAP transporter small permease [Gammaproteobacteria bacterium]|nr:TRAP transporter small permease [Gammaproteobacteria bacterium]MBT8445081.1 TRAP transporter small permease [Gammaproteobacteria bacterium]NND37361.1 TRAP transporter small permease [Gammaproteobacteria bacterium]
MSRPYDRFIDGLAALAGLIIAAACLLIAYDVVARNIGMQPPASTVALTEYALLYFTMAAAPYLVRNKGHIVVEVVYQRLPGSLQRRLDVAILLLCAAVSAIIASLSGFLLVEAAANAEIEIRSLDAPRWALFLPMAVGFALMAIEFLRLLMRGDSVFASQAEQRESF